MNVKETIDNAIQITKPKQKNNTDNAAPISHKESLTIIHISNPSMLSSKMNINGNLNDLQKKPNKSAT